MAGAADDKHHALSLRDRHLLELTGVTKVESFDEHEIALSTQLGMLSVKGENLHIRHLDLENGDLQLDGTVVTLSYQQDSRRKGRLGRLLR
jgi:sporulation protein YabP